MAFTYFFRDFQTLDIASDFFLKIVAGRQKIKIWDAGCAMGQEPYSLLILLAEKMNQYAYKNLSLHASDIDESNLFSDIISSGIYTYEDIKRMPQELLTKYFTLLPGSNKYKLIPEINNIIKFQRHDLLSLVPVDKEFSLIVCKNVLLHFEYSQRVQVIKMFYDSLMNNGLLITEHTQKLPDELKSFFKPLSSKVQIFQKIG